MAIRHCCKMPEVCYSIVVGNSLLLFCPELKTAAPEKHERKDRNMILRRASGNTISEVIAFYREMIAETKGMQEYARWKWNLHPTEKMIREYIANDAMYLLTDEERIAGAMAVTMEQSQDYQCIDWKITIPDEEAAVIHILAVAPEWQKKGIGKRLIEEAVSLAKKARKRALRLDALSGNLPARHLYEQMGFSYCGKRNLYADNTGWTDFCFYEYVL